MGSRVRVCLSIVLVLVVIALGAGCGKVPNDTQVTSEIQDKFNADSGLQGKAITVQTASGVVTLSGTVDNDAQRDAAARYAATVHGIKTVVNNIQVGRTAALAPPPQQAALPPAPVQKVERPSKPKAGTAKHRSNERSAAKSDEIAEAAPARQMPDPQASASTPPPAVAAATAPPPPPPAPKKVTIPSGTTLAIRLVDPIDSETSQPGESFRATLDSPLSVDGDVAIPAGYDVHGHVVDVQSAGKFAGKSLLVLQLDRISVGGKSYSIQTDQYKREGSSRGKNTAEKVGAGAAIGAIIGGIAGGGKGAGIGAAAGGGLGGGVQAATKGQQIKLPTETVLNFSLQSPVTVTPAEGPNPGRPKLDNPQ